MKYYAKIAYRNKKIVDNYDIIRFTSLKGKLMDYLEKKSIVKAIKNFPRNFIFLDIPCGTGRITELLLKKKYEVIGADISFEMLKFTKNRLNIYKNLIGLINTDAENIGFKNDSINCIICMRFMGHLPFCIKSKIIKEFSRISSNYIIITFYFDDIFAIIKRKIKNFFIRKSINWYNEKEKKIDKLIKKNKLRIIKKIPILFFFSEAKTYLIKKNEYSSNK